MQRHHLAASRAVTGCFSSSPIPLLLSEASLPPLRVTLTHFTLLSYERALRLPASFPILGLVKLEVKPRLCRSSWRAFASTHPLIFLLLLPGRLFLRALPFLLGICPRSSWSPPFPLHALALIPSLSRQGAALALFDSLPIPPQDLVLWTDGSVPFRSGKGGSGVLANCSLCDTEVTLSFSAGPVCSSFSAEACAILHALCWPWQHQQVCHFSSPTI